MRFDWIGNNWYMVDNLYSNVFVCSSNFERCLTLCGGKIEKPSAIAVDSTAGYLLYSFSSMSCLSLIIYVLIINLLGHHVHHNQKELIFFIFSASFFRIAQHPFLKASKHK